MDNGSEINEKIKKLTQDIENEPNTKGNDESAIKDYNEVIKLNSKNVADAYFLRGLTYSEAGNYESAIKDYSEVINLKSKYVTDAYYLRGLSYSEARNYESAIKDYGEAINLKSKNVANVYFLRGLAYSEVGNYESAIKDYSDAIKLKSNRLVDAYFFRGNDYVQMKNYESAIKDYSDAIKLKSNRLVDAYFFRGGIYSVTENHELAIKDYSDVINLKSNHLVEAYYFRGRTYNLKKNYKSAIKDYNKVIKLNSKYIAETYYYRSIIYDYQKKNLKQAEKDRKSCIQSFVKSGKEFIDLLRLFDTEQIEKMASLYLDKNKKCDFYNIINSDKNNEKEYKKIYQCMWKIFSLLIINNNHGYAHYTKKSTATDLLIKKSKFRLFSILTTNDPKEGETLFDYLNISNATDTKQNIDYQAFIGCFSFNCNRLNQFRLYGKENSEEGSGISIVLNNNFFSNNGFSNIFSQSILSDNMDVDIQKDEEKIKYPIFRCIYLDPRVSHDENKTFIELSNEDKIYKLDEIEKEIKNLNDQIRTLDNIKMGSEISNDQLITLDKIKEKVIKLNGQMSQMYGNKGKVQDTLKSIKGCVENGIKNGLNANIIHNLLLPIRFLVKDAAFKEEQECRIICVRDINRDARKDEDKREIKFSPDYSQMYIDYQEITDKCLKKVIFGPKAKGFDVFKEVLRHEQIKCDCEESGLPFS